MHALRLVDDCFPGVLAGHSGPADRVRVRPAPLPGPDARRVLSDLLAWNEEMAAQLRAERGEDHTAGFLGTLIAQHEKTIGLLRAELDARCPAGTGVHH